MLRKVIATSGNYPGYLNEIQASRKLGYPAYRMISEGSPTLVFTYENRVVCLKAHHQHLDDLTKIAITKTHCRGKRGATGVRGDISPFGRAGVKGNRGGVGPPGLKGEGGEAGLQVEKGNVGSRGPKGEQGARGSVGSVEPKSEQGVQGSRGDHGPICTKGDQVVRGFAGHIGPKGIQGFQ